MNIKSLTEKKLDIALKALRELEEGFRFSVHGNSHVYHVALGALKKIESLESK